MTAAFLIADPYEPQASASGDAIQVSPAALRGDRQRQAPGPLGELEGNRVRPKTLGIHGRNLDPVATDARVSPAPEKLRSRRRRAGRALDAITLHEACLVANVSYSDCGAAWDLAKESARLVRAGEKAVEPNFGIENAPSRKARVEFFDLLLVRLSRCDAAALLEVLERWIERTEEK